MRLVSVRCYVVTLLIILGSISAALAAGPTFAYETAIPGYYLGSGHDMVVDTEGNAYVIASYYQDEQHLDILIFKLDPEGNVAWRLPIVGDPSEHDYAEDITLDSQENVWITGWTSSESFPLVNAIDDSLTGFLEAFIMKLDPQDGTILYSTFLGGDYTERGNGIAIDDSGEIYVVGSTGSTDFPTTEDAFQDHPSAPLYIYEDAFITKLSPDGQEILYSTYFGGFKDDYGLNIALDNQGNIVFSGQTNSDDFPLADPIQSDPDRIFVSKLSADGSTLLFSTYIGGDDFDELRAMDVDSDGHVYLTGQTRSIDFPATPGAFQEDFVGEIRGCEEYPDIIVNCFDAYVAKMATDGRGVIYGTFLGGSINDRGSNIVVDGYSRAHVVGLTGSPDFLGSGNALASIFVAGLDASGSDLVYSLTKQSPSAGAGHGVAVDGAGAVYFTGAVGIPYKIYVAKIGGIAPPSSGVEGETADVGFGLVSASPNPFVGTTRLTYSLSAGPPSPARLAVYDARGRVVRTLTDRAEGPGTYTVDWDGTDENGKSVAGGVYFYRVEWKGRGVTGRVVLLR
jgi:hypothetical protein